MISFDRSQSNEIAGELRRNQPQALEHSAPYPGQLQFLINAPVTDIFKPRDSVLAPGPRGLLTLSKSLKWGAQPVELSMLISSVTWRPLSMTVKSTKDKRIVLRAVAEGYRKDATGIRFPTKVEFAEIDAAGIPDLKFEYRLLAHSFNSSIPAADLWLGVTPGVRITDYRFGQPVSYKLGHHSIPSDEAVKRVYDAEVSAKSNRSLRNPSSYTLIILIGTAAIVIGLLIWRKSKYEAGERDEV